MQFYRGGGPDFAERSHDVNARRSAYGQRVGAQCINGGIVAAPRRFGVDARGLPRFDFGP
jgi:hypothetical protein